MVKFGGEIGTLYQMLKNAFKKHPLQNRTNVQIKGGGVKGLLNNVKKNCTFLKGWLPLVTNPSSQTLKYKFRAKTILDVAICVIFCSILCFIFSVLRLHQLFLLLSREKKFHQITSLSDSFLSKYFPV